MTNCPNCGAPVDLNADACAYCDTPYTPRAPTKDPSVERAQVGAFMIHMNAEALVKAYETAVLTLDEMRDRRDHNRANYRRNNKGGLRT